MPAEPLDDVQLLLRRSIGGVRVRGRVKAAGAVEGHLRGRRASLAVHRRRLALAEEGRVDMGPGGQRTTGTGQE